MPNFEEQDPELRVRSPHSESSQLDRAAAQGGIFWLVIFAMVALLVPGLLSIYAFVVDYSSPWEALSNKLALAFFLDLLLTTAILAILFARRPPGPIQWPWFVALSLLGTVAFAVPAYLWLNWRQLPCPRPSFISWWRAV